MVAQRQLFYLDTVPIMFIKFIKEFDLTYCETSITIFWVVKDSGLLLFYHLVTG